MGWARQEWERLTNAVWVDCASFLLAQRGRVLDTRFWNGYPLDLQSGYRLYSRSAARIAAESLAALPQEPNVYMMACEMTPFFDLSLQGGRVAQVRTLTRVTQPFSSYAGVPFAECYGALFAYEARQHAIPASVLSAVFENRLLQSPLYYSHLKQEALRCRSIFAPDAGEIPSPRFL